MAKPQANLVAPDRSVEQAFEQILRTNLLKSREWEPVVLAGEDPEGVHQMRVCLRRMRSALAVFRTAIPRQTTRSFLNEMRRAAKALDRARDLDVYIEENLRPKGEKRKDKMRKLALKHRDREYARVKAYIEGKRYRKICEELHHWVESRGWRQDLVDEQKTILEENVVSFASDVLDHQQNRILDDGRGIEGQDSEALHQLRIDCKKLRYAAEFFAPLYGEPMKDFIRHLKALQDLLGTLHDVAVMPGLQRDLLKGKRNRGLKRHARRLVRERSEQANMIRRTLATRWGDFSRAERPWRAQECASR